MRAKALEGNVVENAGIDWNRGQETNTDSAAGARDR